MNSLLLPVLMLAFAASLAHCENIGSLDLRLVSELKFELRNIPQLEDQCNAFWVGLSEKLDKGALQLARVPTLTHLLLRLRGLKNFEKLGAFVEKCIGQKEPRPIGKPSDRVQEMDARLLEMNQALVDKVEQIKQKSLQERNLGEQNQLAGDKGPSDVYREQLERSQDEVRMLKVELQAKDDKLGRMSSARDAAIEKLNQLAKNLGGHASHLVQEKDFAEQQARELRNTLASSLRDHEIKLKAKQEQVDQLQAKVHQLESELYTNSLELSRMREELSSLNKNEIRDQNGRRILKVHVY